MNDEVCISQHGLRPSVATKCKKKKVENSILTISYDLDTRDWRAEESGTLAIKLQENSLLELERKTFNFFLKKKKLSRELLIYLEEFTSIMHKVQSGESKAIVQNMIQATLCNIKRQRSICFF